MKGGQTGKRKAEEVCRRSKGHEVLLMWQKRQKWQNRKKKKDVKNEGGRKEMTEPIEVKKTCSWTPFPFSSPDCVSTCTDSRAHCSSSMLSLMWMLSMRMWPLVGFSKKPSNTTWTAGERHGGEERNLPALKLLAGLQPPHLILFGALGQDGSALPPVRPLVSSELPEEGLAQVAVPQQDPQAALGLPLELVVELQAERAALRLHLGAQQPGLLLLAVAAGVQVQIIPWEIWRGGREEEAMLSLSLSSDQIFCFYRQETQKIWLLEK